MDYLINKFSILQNKRFMVRLEAILKDNAPAMSNSRPYTFQR